MFNSAFYSFAVVLGFVNTLAYPTTLSVARISNVELGTNISLDRGSPPLAALEDISFPELTEDQPPARAPAVEEIRIAAEGKRNFAYNIPPRKVILVETTQFSKSSPEFKMAMTAVAPAAPIQAPEKSVTQAIINSPAKIVTLPVHQPKPAKTEFVRAQSQEDVNGEVEMGDVAFVGGDQNISIRRFTGAIPMEQGNIDLHDGTFNIRVAQRVGKLVARLTNKSNEVVAEGIYSFRPNDLGEKIKIKVYAKSKGPNGTVVSAYSYNDFKVAVKGAKLKLDDLDKIVSAGDQGSFAFDGVSGRSVAILRANAPGFRPSVQFLAGNGATQVTLYPQKMVESFLSFAKPKTKAIPDMNAKGIIWGQVFSLGKPLAGVKLELAGLDLSPIYFNQYYLPELDRNETSDNGMFAYLGVEPGIHQVRGRFLDKVIDGMVVPVAAGYVSPANLELSSSIVERRVGVLDFSNPGRGWLSGVLRVLGIDETHNLNRDENIPGPEHRVPSFFEAFSQNFYPSKIISEESSKDTTIPLVPEQWLNEAAKNSQKEVDHARGAVMVYSQDPIENVTLNGVALEANDPNILMFEGQGIIILNIKPGINSLITKTAGSPDLNLNTMIIDANSISVIDLNNAR